LSPPPPMPAPPPPPCPDPSGGQGALGAWGTVGVPGSATSHEPTHQQSAPPPPETTHVYPLASALARGRVAAKKAGKKRKHQSSDDDLMDATETVEVGAGCGVGGVVCSVVGWVGFWGGAPGGCHSDWGRGWGQAGVGSRCWQARQPVSTSPGTVPHPGCCAAPAAGAGGDPRDGGGAHGRVRVS